MRTLQLLPVIVLVACSSSPSDGSRDPVSGEVGASSLDATSAVAWYGSLASFTDNAGTRDIPGLKLWISDRALSCSSIALASSVLLDLAIYGDAVESGEYAIVSTRLETPGVGEAGADFNDVDPDCGSTVSASSVGGRLTLEEVGARVRGSLDITLEGGSVSGWFDAELCPAMPAASCMR
jgi:hypothetical protein